MEESRKQFFPGSGGWDIFIWLIILFFIFGGGHGSFFGLGTEKKE